MKIAVLVGHNHSTEAEQDFFWGRSILLALGNAPTQRDGGMPKEELARDNPDT